MGNGQSGEAKKRKRKKDTSNKKNQSQATIEEDDGKSIETTTVLANSPDKEKGLPLTPLTEKVMQELVNRTTTLGIAGLRNEWINVAGHIPPNLHSELFEHNTQRNAPGSNPCIDCTRVQLHLEVPPQTEYIHANWVVSSHADLPRMIMTQGPLDQTVTDFWRMVYQEKVRTIVMLCDKYENGRRIVAQYWPPRVGDANTYGQVRVQLNSNVTPENESAYTKWNLTVSYRNQAALTTHLYCIKKWPGKQFH
uniref:Tyrosine-protein phosphatase domain-containing protein n=1 Tax=Panagrellus redivivus TaxID=6233 RepID=A0A7E4V5E0_PANRE